MCAPAVVAGASLLIQAGSAVAEHVAQDRQARDNERRAAEARRTETRDISIRQVEERISSERQIDQVRLQAAQLSGEASASAAAAGVRGASLDALIGTIRGQEGTTVQNIRDQATLTIDQLTRLKESAGVRERGRVASVPRPSLLGTGLRIASAGVDTALTIRGRPRNR
jgi:hypothetical protein